MVKAQGWARVCLAVIGLLSGAHAWAQSGSVTPEDEFKKSIRVSEDVQPLGEHPFGENISLYNGSLSFEQVDIDLAGNGPPLRLARSFNLPDMDPARVYQNFLNSPLVDWKLDNAGWLYGTCNS